MRPVQTRQRTPLLAAAAIAGAYLLAPEALAGDFVVSTGTEFSIALATAADGDTITMLPGTYTQIPGWSFADKRLTISGSTGNREDVVIDGVNVVIGLTITGADASGSIIENLTIRNGRGGTTENASGGGIRIEGAGVTIRNCLIENNIVPGPDGNGAGIYATQGSLRIEDSLIRNNTISDGAADGVGVYCNGGDHVILQTRFVGNGIPGAFTTNSIGGGFYADGGTARIADCLFEGNRAGNGGAIGVSGSMTMIIDNCRFIDNAARNGGGYYMTGVATSTTSRIRNSLFAGNTASVNDSAVFTNEALNITNSTFYGNTSPSYVVGGSPPAGSVKIDNSIVWGNTLNGANGLFPAGMAAVAQFNLLQQPYTLGSGTGSNRVEDPQLTDAGAGDFTLLPTSPAIDSGGNGLYFGPFTDLAGNPRAVDDPNTEDSGFTFTGPVIDIGAFEFAVNVPSSCPADFDDNNVVNSNDISAFLTGWLQAVGIGCP